MKRVIFFLLVLTIIVEPSLFQFQGKPAKKVMQMIGEVVAGEVAQELAGQPLEKLIDILNNQDEIFKTRLSAASSLGEKKDVRAIKPLIAFLKEFDKFQDAMAKKIAEQGQAQNIFAPIIQAMLATTVFREIVEEALVKIGTPAVRPMIEALNDESSNTRYGVINALGKIGTPSVDPLIKELKNNSIRIRGGAAEALGITKDPNAIKPLIIALKDKDHEVRSKAARALGQIGNADVVDPLIESLKDEATRVRAAAVVALGNTKDLRAAGPLIAALKDKEEYVTQFVPKALKNITGQDFGEDQAKWQAWWEENRAK